MVQEGLQAKKRSTAITQKIYFAENTLIRKIKSLNVGWACARTSIISQLIFVWPNLYFIKISPSRVSYKKKRFFIL